MLLHAARSLVMVTVLWCIKPDLWGVTATMMAVLCLWDMIEQECA